ncbi:MAG: hypothetical protein IPM36_08600 [Lewinellaceae bacterium]|nr:hypothetical protein [Lewinellaceae bacterium]
MRSDFNWRLALPLFALLPAGLWLCWQYWFAPPPTAMGQISSSCLSLPCDGQQLYVQIVPDPDYVSTSSCQTSTPCGDGDLFTQLYYLVQLVYVPGTSNEPLSFALGYREIKVDLRTQITGSTTNIAYSYINSTVTEDCHKVTAQTNGWSEAADDGMGGFTNGVNFSADESSASIAFYNYSTSCPEAAVINFSPPANTPCPNDISVCTKTDLFRVVVNAYPGETVDFNIDFALYDVTGEALCTDINGVITPGAAPLPATAIPGTTNGNMQLRLTDPSQLPDGGCMLSVELVNKNSFAVDVDYLEFVLKVDLIEAAEPVVTSAYARPTLALGDSRYIHFIVPDQGWQLAANGGMQSIGSITIKPPLIGNSSYNAVISLIDGNKSRIKTPGSCTNLPVSIQSKTCEGGGQSTCTDNEGVVFTVEGLSASACNTTIRFGFVDTETSTANYLQLKDISVKLQITTSGDVQFDAATFSSNWINGCPIANSCNDCISAVKNGDVIDFEYCVSISDIQTAQVSIDLLTNPQAYVELAFTGQGCIESIGIPELFIRREGEQNLCIPPLASGIPPFLNIPLCTPNIYGTLQKETGEGIADVTVLLEPQSASCSPTVCPDEQMVTGASGTFGFCPCAECQYFTVRPEKDNDPLNGVSTFDLVLINKHILGLEPLNSPYKIIAADANKMNGVTTFDIVELRKLILGIYTELPNNTSWRFVDKAYVFPNPLNPFQTIFPETVNGLDPNDPNNNQADFIAIKVGDVNGNAAPNRPGALERAPLSWPKLQSKSVEKTITLPVVYTGADTLLAFQLALQFDPTLLQLLSPSAGDLPGFTQANYNVADASQGRLRLLWFPADLYNPDLVITPGAVLFYLHFKTLAPLPEGELPIQIDNDLLPGLAYAADGKAFNLDYEPDPSARFTTPMVATGDLTAGCAPNPGTEALSIRVDCPDERKARIALYDPNGVRVFARDVSLVQGAQVFRIEEAASLTSGVYIWKVIAPGAKVQGFWIKL